MSTTLERASAQIFQFPPRGRFAAANNDAAARDGVSNVVQPSFGSWYHEEAIQNEQRRDH